MRNSALVAIAAVLAAIMYLANPNMALLRRMSTFSSSMGFLTKAPVTVLPVSSGFGHQRKPQEACVQASNVGVVGCHGSHKSSFSSVSDVNPVLSTALFPPFGEILPEHVSSGLETVLAECTSRLETLESLVAVKENISYRTLAHEVEAKSHRRAGRAPLTAQG